MRSLPSMLALCVLAGGPAARAAPASREVLDTHVSTLFANCVRAARVTLELAWDDTFLVIHFLNSSAPSPVPVPPIPPPPAPSPRR